MGNPPPTAEPAPFDEGAAQRAWELPEDERLLVERAATDADAFAALYRRYVDAIYRFAYRRCGSRAAAEDVTSATFEKALRSLEVFQWRPGGFRPWLYRIAANEVADHHRRVGRDATPRAQRALRVLGADQPEEPELPGEELVEDSARVRAALAAINPRYQEALSLRYLADLSPEETAAALGCSRGTLAVVLHRATRALRRQLELPEPTS